jgi:hypothetical protein
MGRCRPIWPATCWRPAGAGCGGVGSTPHPSVGPLVGGDPHRRRFDGHLKKLIMWRDRRCRDPFCDAPIRHIDHIERYTDGGLTIYPNGRGECERGNYAREMPGWEVRVVSGGWGGKPHTIKITTPGPLTLQGCWVTARAASSRLLTYSRHSW